jgi:hypothetical protein
MNPSLVKLVKYNFGIMDFATKQGRDKKITEKQTA